MCGRYTNAASIDDLFTEFEVDEMVGEAPPPSWNIAPTDPVQLIAERPRKGSDEITRQLRTARWGLVPGWSTDAKGGARMINARSETITVKPAFRKAAADRRCLIPAQGYYEWQPVAGGKVPYYLHQPDEPLLAFAGLFELWRDPAKADDDPQRWLWTTTVITRPATDLLGEIHDRCPVLVPRDLRAAWLDCSASDNRVAERLLAACPDPVLVPQQVGPAVGNVRNNGPELIGPVTDAPLTLFHEDS